MCLTRQSSWVVIIYVCLFCMNVVQLWVEFLLLLWKQAHVQCSSETAVLSIIQQMQCRGSFIIITFPNLLGSDFAVDTQLASQGDAELFPASIAIVMDVCCQQKCPDCVWVTRIYRDFQVKSRLMWSQRGCLCFIGHTKVTPASLYVLLISIYMYSNQVKIV